MSSCRATNANARMPWWEIASELADLMGGPSLNYETIRRVTSETLERPRPAPTETRLKMLRDAIHAELLRAHEPASEVRS